MRGEVPDGRAEVGPLAGGVLVLAPTRALAESAVVEDERGESRPRQLSGVRPDDLFLQAGERPGEDNARDGAGSPGRKVEGSDETHAVVSRP